MLAPLAKASRACAKVAALTASFGLLSAVLIAYKSLSHSQSKSASLAA